MLHARRRPGFTLLQLIIILIVLAILFALLLPAVARVREAAARSVSQNNLKQLGLGIHNILATYDSRCPPSVGSFPNQQGPKSTLWFFLLPFIEQENLFKLHYQPAGEISTKIEAPIKIYCVPGDPTNPGNSNRLSYATNQSVFGGTTRNLIAALNQKGLSNTLMFVERYSENAGKDKVTTMTWPDTRDQITYVTGTKTALYDLPEGKEPTTAPIDAAHCIARGRCQALFADGAAISITPSEKSMRNFAIAMDATNNKAPGNEW